MRTFRRRTPDQPPVPTRSAYVEALTMLARRELSEAQIRQRLARKGHAPADVDAAVERLRAERAINDARVAEAIARTEVSVRRRGRLRVRRQIEQTGIAPATARQALAAVFADVDDDALLETALDRRCRGQAQPLDDAAVRRLYRYLVGQGFASDRVLSALKRRRTTPARDDD
ncbi:MAG: RecX family transcriptional regulator [Acidobacteriota bacterium]